MKSIAHGATPKFRFGQFDEKPRFRFSHEIAQHPIVGRQIPLLADLGIKDPPLRSDTWIDDYDVQCPRRKNRRNIGEHDGSLPHILRRDAVSEINQVRAPPNRKQSSLHGRDVGARGAKIGGQ